MGQLESLMKLNIAQSSRKKKTKKKKALVDSSNGSSIVLYYYVGKILKPHDYRLFHFTHQGTCVIFYYLNLSDLDVVKISKDLKAELIYLSLIMNQNHCLCDAIFSFDNMI
jgi:hypothetical protein